MEDLRFECDLRGKVVIFKRDGGLNRIVEEEKWRRYIPFRPILSFAITSIILELRGLLVSRLTW
jgi:hypothetical protein